MMKIIVVRHNNKFEATNDGYEKIGCFWQF